MPMAGGGIGIVSFERNLAHPPPPVVHPPSHRAELNPHPLTGCNPIPIPARRRTNGEEWGGTTEATNNGHPLQETPERT